MDSGGSRCNASGYEKLHLLLPYHIQIQTLSASRGPVSRNSIKIHTLSSYSNLEDYVEEEEGNGSKAASLFVSAIRAVTRI